MRFIEPLIKEIYFFKRSYVTLSKFCIDFKRLTLNRLIIYFLFFSLCPLLTYGQSIHGYVLDENNVPIPFAKVYVKNYTNYGAVTNFEGYYSFSIDQGQYEVMYSSLGYEPQTHNVIVKSLTPTRQDVYLVEQINELEEVEISKKRRNVGYEIIQNVMAHKDSLAYPFQSYSCEMYIKGRQTSEKKTKNNSEDEEGNTDPSDVFEEEAQKQQDEIKGQSNLSFFESTITAHYAPPYGLKELKNAYTQVGNTGSLYLKKAPVTPDAEFNFYEGLMVKENLHETPIVSPLHAGGILSYKYRLREIITEGEDTIYRVNISPRNIGTSSLEGDLYVKQHDWVITKVDLEMHKGNLKVYDYFRIVQEYTYYDSVWLVSHQHFYYETKYGKETIKGETEVSYSNYQLNPVFPKKFFNNEVGITTQQAYERDSSYWDTLRPIPLTKEEQRQKFKQDSLTALFSKQEYIDSIDAVFNKVTFLKVAVFGVEHRNRKKKTQWWVSSVVDLIEPFNIAGPRIGPDAGYFKKFENQQWVDFTANITMGVLNKDLRGYARTYHRYNPKRFGTYQFYYSHNIDQIIGYAPILDYIDPSNYYMRDKILGNHLIEIVNGLFLGTTASLERRSSIGNLEFYNLWGDYLQTAPPIDFEPYNAFRTNIYLNYTPFQKFVTEPNKKIILGSKWPTFSLSYEKGWDVILGSTVNFDYIAVSASQDFSIGTLGRSKYQLKAGSFINQDSLYYIDRKFFRQSDVGLYGWLMSNPLHSFQNLQSAYETRNWYFEGHYIHHFNGAIVNKIPFMKKTGIKAVGGAGILFLPEYDNLLYEEAYFGLERIFKLFRQRIRVGGFMVLSESNYQPANIQFKLSFDIMDERDLKFNF